MKIENVETSRIEKLISTAKVKLSIDDGYIILNGSVICPINTQKIDLIELTDKNLHIEFEGKEIDIDVSNLIF